MRRNPARTWMLRGVAACMLAATFGYIPYHLYTRSGFAKYLELRAHLETQRRRNDELKAHNVRLAREVEALRSDPAAVERVAREELGWVRPGELLVDLSAAVEASRP